MTEVHTSENKNHDKKPYYDIDTLLGMIEGPNGEACRQIHEDYKDKFVTSPGSRNNHQYWPGGYVDHITDAMNIGLLVYRTFDQQRPLEDEFKFTASDVLLIVYLHDLEKPFVYEYDDDGTVSSKKELLEKPAREEFKRNLIDQYGIELSARQDNALEFVEGIRDHKYKNTSRVMGELAVVCHMADLASARLWYNHPLAEDDAWSGAKRQNPAARDVVLQSEFAD